MIALVKKFLHSNDALYAAALSFYMNTLFRTHARYKASQAGLSCQFNGHRIDLKDGNRVIRADARHAVYLFDLIAHFDFFFDAVEPEQIGGAQVVDYSSSRSHVVKGFDLHPVRFPSIAEPVQTTEQYLEFAALTEGSVAIDLGAYSGLTSILFSLRCGAAGKVIAVEADADNLAAARANFERFADKTGLRIELLEGAAWEHNDGIDFSNEGSMGSSASDIVGERMKESSARVPSFTLSAIAARYELTRIDFIKCDIEGAEAVIFSDSTFFDNFRPRMIVEVHPVKGQMTTDAVCEMLRQHGYKTKLVLQDGYNLPLLECLPRLAI